MARAAPGADGVLIEVHNNPEHLLSDGAQSIEPSTFTQLMAELRIIAPAIGRRMARVSTACRKATVLVLRPRHPDTPPMRR
jgi:3-deoxy-D-manno-octulosonic acid (KDO) 8-phosphate synthase